ncbi:MAG: tetratricopeptide repeat protein [Proteobacteria bacterium]|nr:tetratricopeptide repeat protein [Pseudomonadota bacterium]
MSNRKKPIASALAALALALAACSGTEKQGSLYAAGDVARPQAMLQASRSAAESALREPGRGDKQGLAEKGIEAAERCLMAAPENPGCYYWRAVNTGIYHSVRIAGYQRGVKRMVADCEKIIQIDPGYENAGAYRMLGQIYTKLPQTAIHPGSVTRDIELAESYLRKAVQLAPGYPENRLALAEALFENGKVKDAIEELAQANELAPHWRRDISYDQWKHESLALERRIGKAQ